MPLTYLCSKIYVCGYVIKQNYSFLFFNWHQLFADGGCPPPYRILRLPMTYWIFGGHTFGIVGVQTPLIIAATLQFSALPSRTMFASVRRSSSTIVTTTTTNTAPSLPPLFFYVVCVRRRSKPLCDLFDYITRAQFFSKPSILDLFQLSPSFS